MRRVFLTFVLLVAVLGTGAVGLYASYRQSFKGRVYPNVYIDSIPFGGKTPDEVKTYWMGKNNPFANITLELRYDAAIATISGTDLDLGYDATLSATQAYVIGRSNRLLSNVYNLLFRERINLAPYLRWNTQVVDNALERIANTVNAPAQDALFTFANGRVTAFRPSQEGRQLNSDEALARIQTAFFDAAKTGKSRLTVELPIDSMRPNITTDKVNSFGIKTMIGRGYSEFKGSIPNRVHNIALAANRINGVLIKPGETFSFNKTVGDISAATGYQSAYIIKDGRTVLGDGGGVCQVSTTLFRAILAAGLPVAERNAHSYRVQYYEQSGYKPGLDATVYAPSVDLKFTNDTPGYILIQAKTDLTNYSLTFELYGTSDGRAATISNQKLWDVTPPPPDLYQDDPTLPKGTVKQVDFSAWGGKASFDYTVVRNGETLEQKTFYSNYSPWQAVYLRGTL